MKTYSKLIKRGIRRNFSRFLSIFTIVALGSGFLAGVTAAAPDMEKSTDAFLDKHNTYDINIKSTLGITAEDVAILSSVETVANARGEYVQDLMMEDDGQETYLTRVMSVPFDELELIEGRLPKAQNEILIEIISPYMRIDKGTKTLKISTANRNMAAVQENFSETDFSVVGIVESPYYISVEGEMSTIGNGYVEIGAFALKDTFKMDVYTDVFLDLKGAKKLDSFGEEYKAFVKEKEKKVRAIGQEREKKRTRQVKAEAREKLNIEKNKFEAEKGKAEQQLLKAKNQLVKGKLEAQNGQRFINQGRAQLMDSKVAIDELKNAIAVETDPTTKAFLEQQLLQAEAIYIQTENLLNSKQAELDRGKSALTSGEAEYNREKTKAEREFLKGETKLEEAETEINSISNAEWIYFDRTDNMGINSFKGNTDKVRAIAAAFPIFFLAVAILVALTTMTRMIEEERLQIGALKALGYYNKSVLKYYMIYSMLAATLGCTVGVILGFKIFPLIIANAYSMLYTLPKIATPFIPWIGIPVVAVILGSVLLTTYFSCRGELKENAASLLLPKAPKPGKRILIERIKPLWNKIGFSHKVTLRNIFRYRKRFLMTIIGIAGSFALLLTGFGLRDSISDIVEKQYSELYKFDYTIFLSDEKWAAEDEVIGKVLNDKEKVSEYTQVANNSAVISANGKKEKDTTICIPKENKEITKYYNLRERVGHKLIPFDENSIVVTEKMAENLGVKAGDYINIDNKKGEAFNGKITGVTENYVNSYVYMSKETYSKKFKEQPNFSIISGKAGDKFKGQEEKLSEELVESDNVEYVLISDTVKQTFGNSVKSINYVILVIILCAGALVVVVLYNLINVNICERKKELATIEVLGFYNKEIYAYIFRETNLLCFIGMAVGIPFGISLHQFVIRTAEVDGVMFGREISWFSFLISAMITIIFIIIVNRIMRKSIKDINMVESMKAND